MNLHQLEVFQAVMQSGNVPRRHAMGLLEMLPSALGAALSHQHAAPA